MIPALIKTILLIAAICWLMTFCSCSKDNEINECKHVTQWNCILDNGNYKTVSLSMDYGIVCDEGELIAFKKLAALPPQQWCNTETYIKTEIK